MRIALVCPGDSLHTLPWVEELARRGHDVLVYAYPPVTVDFSHARVTAVRGAGPVGRALWLWRQVHSDLPDVVSQHYVATDALALSLLGKPLVLSAWGSDLLRDLDRPLKRVLIARALRSAVLVVSPAMHMTERLLALGVRPERVVTHQYGVDTNEFSPASTPANNASAQVICTRSLEPVYGHEDILHALPRVSDDLVAEVVFTGRGSQAVELLELAEALCQRDRVSFVGGLDHAKMPDALRSAALYCSMSRSDGASLSLLEAMSCGLPVVVSDIPANREWIDSGLNGILVPCAKPDILAARLTEVAGDHALRERLGRAARQTVLERGDRAQNVPAIIDAVERTLTDA